VAGGKDQDPRVERYFALGEELDGPDAQLRLRHEDPDQVMDLLDLQPGDQIADVGCGVGFSTTRFARAVGPTGGVLATEVDPANLSFLRQRLDRDASLDPHNSVTLKQSSLESAGLPTATLDRVFVSYLDPFLFVPLPDTYYQLLGDSARALKPDGQLVFLLWPPAVRVIDPSTPTDFSHLLQAAREQGLEEVSRVDLDPVPLGGAAAASGEPVPATMLVFRPVAT
jgi:ubiquinone/menaquinone biosynthesis C-methylase UbiE